MQDALGTSTNVMACWSKVKAVSSEPMPLHERWHPKHHLHWQCSHYLVWKDSILQLIKLLQADYILIGDGDLRDYLGVRIIRNGFTEDDSSLLGSPIHVTPEEQQQQYQDSWYT